MPPLAGEKATLPGMAAKFLGGVAVGGVLAIDVHHKEGDGVGEDGLAVVAALGEMEPVSGRGEAISAGQGGFGASVY